MHALWRGPRLAQLLLVASILLPPAQALAAGGAFVVDDVEIGEFDEGQVGKPGECKVESWTAVAANHDFAAVTSPACVVKLGIPVEVGGALARTRADSVWGTTGIVKAKANIIPVEGHAFGVGIAGGVSWDLMSGANTGGYFYVPFTTQITKQFRINVNAGGLIDNIAKTNYFTYGAGFEWGFIEKFKLIGEVFGQLGRRPEWVPTPVVQPKTQLGVRYSPIEKIDIDVIWGYNIAGENSQWLTLGMNYRF